MANEMMNRFAMDLFFDRLARRFFSPTEWENDTISNGDLKTDIKETDKDYMLKVNVPGIDKKNIHLAYNHGDLEINVDQAQASEKKDDQGRLIASERTHGVMSRTYELPGVDRDHISAKIDNGVLNIILPKSAESTENGNQIEIQ